MKNYIRFTSIFLIMFFVSAKSYTQEVVVGYSLGYGAYQMGDMKNLQEINVKATQETVKNYKSLETFPNNIFHNAHIGVKFLIHEIGLKYDYLTTAGRNHLKDYSGEIKEDIVAVGNAIGLYYKIYIVSLPLTEKIHFSTNWGLSTGIIYNKIETHGIFKINSLPPYISTYNYDFDELQEATSSNWYIQPNLGFQFLFAKYISLNFNVGYQFDNPGKISSPYGTTNYSYYLPGHGNITEYHQGREYDFGIDWSGLRASVGIGFTFPVIRK